MSKRILLISAYEAISHARWRRGLIEYIPEYAWRVLTLPARHFNWRIRGNALSFATGKHRRELDRGADLIIATSMTNLANLRGLVPRLVSIPTILYFHENQFAYPSPDDRIADTQMVTLYSALAADCLVYNSEFNRRTFLDGVTRLLHKLPDAVPPGIVARLAERSQVLPVPIEDRYVYCGRRVRDQRLTIVWNHRWEYDKAPERLLNALLRLKQGRVEFDLHVMGQTFRDVPDCFDRMRREFAGQIRTWGYVESEEDYRALLARAHVVVSTALHDFQGLAVLDGVAAGCIPVVPDRLAYMELFDSAFRYRSDVSDPDREAEALAATLTDYARLAGLGRLPEPPEISSIGWATLGPRYRRLITEVMGDTVC